MTAAVHIRLEADRLNPEAELAALMAQPDGTAGAIVCFTGVARAIGKDGSPIDSLRLDRHPRLTEQSMRAIADAAAARFDISACVAVHRCGDVAPGAPIVFAAAASTNRREAFLAADFMMDHLKTEAAFWKCEIGPSGAHWIEASERDLQDLARWRD